MILKVLLLNVPHPTRRFHLSKQVSTPKMDASFLQPKRSVLSSPAQEVPHDANVCHADALRRRNRSRILPAQQCQAHSGC
jgi:hypothetical protein